MESTSAATPARSSAVDVAALGGVRAMLSVDTRRDRGQRSALLRARGWITPQFAASIAAGPAATPSAIWTSWVAHRAVVTATTTLGGDEHPADTATTAYRQVLAVQRAHGADGWTDEPVATVVAVSLQAINHRWLIAATQTS